MADDRQGSGRPDLWGEMCGHPEKCLSSPSSVPPVSSCLPLSPSSDHLFLWNSCPAFSLASLPLISPSSPWPSPGSSAALKPLSLVSVVLHLLPHAPLWPHVPPFFSTLFQPHQAVGSSTNPSYFLLSLGLCTFHSLYLECFALRPLPWAPAHQHLPVRADWRGRYPSPSDVTDINMGFQGPSPIVTPPGPDDRPEDRSGRGPLTSETFPKPYWLSF